MGGRMAWAGEREGGAGRLGEKARESDRWRGWAILEKCSVLTSNGCRFVDDEVRKVLDKKPIVLPLWDPMGALATN